VAKLSVDKALLKAKFHAKKGEVEEAQNLYQAVLQSFPKNKRAQEALAALNKPKQPAATQGPPQDTINQLINLYNQGQLTKAIEQANTLTGQYPEAFVVWNVLGAANNGLGRVEEASEAFKKVTVLNPNYADGFNNLGVALKNQGKMEEAVDAYNKALSINPDYAEAYNNMGAILQNQGKLEEAVEAYNKAVAINPDYADAYYNMGATLNEQGKLEEAVEAYNKVLSIKTDYAEAYNNLGGALNDQGKLEEAIETYNKVLSIKPDYAEVYYNMGNTLSAQGKQEEAIEAYNKALSLKPNDADTHLNIGVVLKEQGKLEEAIETYNKALSIKPDYAEAHRHLSTLTKYEPKNTQIVAVKALMEQTNLNDEDICLLHYTSAKMKEDLGNLAAAFRHYAIGGALRKKLLSYDLEQDRLIFENIKNTAPKFKAVSFKTSIEENATTPIFILGMPRSGTTLVEQIISAHPKVQGAGELNFLKRFGVPIRRSSQAINSDNILQFRKTYLDELEKFSNAKPLVTDKMPQNFLLIDLILKALPEAKIIHIKRDPAATCWSNFKHYFSEKGLGYSYDLHDTVSYFKMYQDLMSFWGELYGDRIYHFDYEKLTLDQEFETRKLIDHLELDWEDACLSPQENKRSVRTASQRQVREKVYKGSSQAWRKFELYLDGAFDELLT